jgi:hypothetical protein
MTLNTICTKCGRAEGEHSREALRSANPHGWKWPYRACPVGKQPFHPEQSFSAPLSNTCNRHVDCAAADAKAASKGRVSAAYCHDEDCEDCFGT